MAKLRIYLKFYFNIRIRLYKKYHFQGLLPIQPGVIRSSPGEKLPETSNDKSNDPVEPDSSTPKVSLDNADDNSSPNDINKETPAAPLPPSTQSPIPLNQFGLPPAVLPLGRFDPTFDGFTQISPFYTYPGFRFYDPYDPYNLNAYPNFPPFFRGIPNLPGSSIPTIPQVPSASSPANTTSDPITNSSAPPSEPNDLNVLNYSAKDPAIPNVPPPPLPQGGLKSDASE